MDSPEATYSPRFRNIKLKKKLSPVEMKQKLRKDYKDKIKNCRDILLNRFRGQIVEIDTVYNTLTEIYNSMFNFSDTHVLDKDENEFLDDIKKDLIQEELKWWLKEYENYQLDNIDWSLIEQEDSLICPLCQKTNTTLHNRILSCSPCNYTIKTHKSLSDIQRSITSAIELHNDACNNVIQFTLIPDLTETHIYLICDKCTEMQCIV